MKEKVILAYSGGLDTTAIIPWLKETFDYEVICCCIDCGQGNELNGSGTSVQNFPALPNYILKILSTNSATNILCRVYRQALSMSTNICSAPLWHARQSQRNR